MLNTIKPEFYPYLPIIMGLILIVAILYYVCYRHTDVTNILLVAFAAMIFLHLDLLAYDMTYSWFLSFMNFFALDKINGPILILIDLAGLFILALTPFLIWFIPMVMMDEKLTGDICSQVRLIRIKSGLILVFGIIMNVFFVLALLKSQGLTFFNIIKS